jgi:aspartate aminotransferase
MKELSDAAQNIEGQPMFKVLDQVKRLEAEGRHILHFEIGDPDFNTPENIVDAACRSIRNGDVHYTSSMGLMEFRRKICEVTERSRGFFPDVDQVLVVPGANAGIFFAVFCLVNPGDEVIIPNPGFPTYSSVIKMCGSVPVYVPLKEENSFRMNPDDIESAITDKTRLIIINSPQNPTGSVMKPEEIEAVYNIAEKHDVYLYSDEIYARLQYENIKFSSPAKYDQCKKRTIVANGFSKAFAMTGWRLGALIGPEEVITKMGLLLQTVSSCVSPFIQQAGIEAILGNQTEVEKMMQEYQNRRDIFVDGLNMIDGFSCIKPDGAFYLFVNIKTTGMSSESLAAYLLEDAGVAVLPGNCFGDYGEGYIRLCYATARADILDAITKMKHSMSKLLNDKNVDSFGMI